MRQPVMVNLTEAELRTLDELVKRIGTSRQDVIERLLRCACAALKEVTRR